MKQITETKQSKTLIYLMIGFVVLAQLFFNSLEASAQTLRERIVTTQFVKQPIASKKTADLPFEVKYRLLTMKNYTVFDWLEAKTDADGNVTLRGQVTNQSAKAKAESVVAGIEGVSNIANQIEVLPASEKDASLRKMLYRAIYNQNTPLFPYSLGSVPPIHIIVKNGSVVLLGAVESRNESDMAFVAANAVPNVARVTNKLQTRNNLVAYTGKLNSDK